MDTATTTTVLSACFAAIAALFAVVMRSKASHYKDVTKLLREDIDEKAARIERLEKELADEAKCADELTEKVEGLLRAKASKNRRELPPLPSKDDRRERAKSAVHDMTMEISSDIGRSE